MKYLIFGLIAYQLLKPKSQERAAIGKPRKFIEVPVYSKLPKDGKNGKTNLGFTKGKTGVYLIKENNRIVYVGQSKSNLYITIMRHFYYWEDESYEGRKYNRFSYFDYIGKRSYKVEVTFEIASKVEALEAALVEEHQPRDNADKLEHILESRRNQVDKVHQQYEEVEYEEAPF